MVKQICSVFYGHETKPFVVVGFVVIQTPKTQNCFSYRDKHLTHEITVQQL